MEGRRDGLNHSRVRYQKLWGKHREKARKSTHRCEEKCQESVSGLFGCEFGCPAAKKRNRHAGSKLRMGRFVKTLPETILWSAMSTSIISYNVNGIRAALRKGLLAWLTAARPHILCLQEVRAEKEVIDCQPFIDLGYQVYWMAAERKGYSGVATLTRIAPRKVSYGLAMEAYDKEGRLLRLDFEDFSLMNTYMPSGNSSSERLAIKHRWQEDFQRYIRGFMRKNANLILCGDYNVAHREIDIHDPVGNKKTSGFLPEERAWLTAFMAEGFVDSFRLFNQAPEQYTWWNTRIRAREKNMGWRIDYHLVSKALKDRVKRSIHLPEVYHSDHCPILLELD